MLGLGRAHLTRGGAILDTSGGRLSGLALNDHARGLRARDDREIGAALRLAFQERMVGARPLAPPGGALHKRYQARRAAPVASVVIASRDARGHGGLDEIARGRENRGADRDTQRAVDVVRLGVDHDLAGWARAPRLLRKYGSTSV